MTTDQLNQIFSQNGISCLQEIGNQVFLIEHVDAPGEKQVLKVIDICRKAKEQANATYSEDIVKRLLGNLHGKELIWNEKITLTQCEYLVRILEDYTIESSEEDLFLYAIRMPYYQTLSSLIREKGLDENTIIHLGGDLCNALRTLHHDGSEEFYQNETIRFGTVLHLDMKPDNIFYEEKDGHGTFMLGDFETVIEKGKPARPMRTQGYYAPELEDFHCVPEETADIFSVGMILYRCLCASEEALDAFWEMRCSDQRPAKPTNCSDQLWEVILGATEPDPAKRYQSAIEVQSALRKINISKVVAAENASTLSSIIAIMEAGVLISGFLKKLKKSSSKKGQLDFGYMGSYEGSLKDGNPHGKGKWTYTYGNETISIFGTWEWVKKKKMKCNGVKIIYTGMLCDGKIYGICQFEIPKTAVFYGITNNGDLQIGTVEWANGEVSSGHWAVKNGSSHLHGEGIHILADGSIQKGIWEYGTLLS